MKTEHQENGDTYSNVQHTSSFHWPMESKWRINFFLKSATCSINITVLTFEWIAHYQLNATVFFHKVQKHIQPQIYAQLFWLQMKVWNCSVTYFLGQIQNYIVPFLIDWKMIWTKLCTNINSLVSWHNAVTKTIPICNTKGTDNSFSEICCSLQL